jgi:EmrB/QacA subfamily drug resistance transporter
VTGRADSTAATAGGGSRRLGLALVVIATAQLMVVLDATIVNVALPHIERALGFSGSGLEWVVNAYAVTFGGLLLLGGRAGDILGRRRVFVFGLLLFSAASLLGGFATSEWWLLTARAVQGVGGAVIAPTALALITTNFPEGAPRNRAFGVYAAMAGAGSATGLLLGGILTTYLSWRWVLFVNVPIGIVVAAAAPRVLAESPRRPGRIDVAGAVTGTGGVALLVYGLSKAATGPDGVSHWGDAQVLVSLAASVVLLVSFVLIERRSSRPLLPMRLLADRSRSGAYLIMLCIATGLFGVFFFLTLFIQNVLGYSAIRAGIAFLPFAVGVVIASALASQLVPRIGPRPLIVAGAAAVAGGTFWFPADRARRLPRPAARPDARELVRARPGVRPAGPGRPAQRGRAGLRCRLQRAQRRPAGRRRDRAGTARHRRLDKPSRTASGPRPRTRRRRREDGPATAQAGHPPTRVHLRSCPDGRLFPRVRCRRGDRAARHAHRDRHHPGPPPGPVRYRARAATGGTAARGTAARGTAARDRAAA